MTTMAPSDETSSTVTLSPQRNVTFAVNYEVSIVDRFWQRTASPRLKNKDSSIVQTVGNSTLDVNPTNGNNTATSGTTPNVSNLDNAPKFPFRRQSSNEETSKKAMNKDNNINIDMKNASDEESTGSCKENKDKNVTIKSPTTEKRRSTREMKKRQVPIERTRVRYDMEMVPSVKRNRAFLDKFPLWSTPSTKREDKVRALHFRQQQIIKEHQQEMLLKQQNAAQKQQQQQQPVVATDQSKNTPPAVDQKQNGAAPVAEQPQNEVAIVQVQQQTAASSDVDGLSCLPVVEAGNVASDASPELVDDEEVIMPFGEDTSVIWVPKKRQEWEDSVLEMTAVCTSAALRRHYATGGKSSSSKPFHAPLSKEYIRDRVDIDDPLNGYQIRHKTGGWLQGFILWTNFTTWTHYFKWDSSHAMSGIPTMNSNGSLALVDSDGSLAQELEQQPRSGNPFEGGVVFEGVAEISLVGGLGCGEYLLRMALESILAKRKYKFVVLQATDSSKMFYERFGFVRVGAICRYERREKDNGKPGVRPDTPIMGYRHWTHANESDSSLQKHGGPSYMMCLKLPEVDENETIETPFLDEMMKLEVMHKPTIQPLGGSSTPYPKSRRGLLDNASSVSSNESTMISSSNGTRRRASKGRRSSNGSPRTVSGSSLAASFNAGSQSPPVLPILRGSSVADNPVRNIACASEKGEEKIQLNTPGLKRASEGTSTVVPSSKRRRVSVSNDAPSGQEINKQISARPSEGSKMNRRPSRDRSRSVNPSIPASEKKPFASTKKSAPKRSTPRRKSGPTAKNDPILTSPAPPVPATNSDPNRTGLMKQKVKSYPRDRIHFYNKVVRPKKGKKTENYFVLHYDEAKRTIRIIPMEPRGILSGKRAGRPRFQAIMSNVARDAKTVPCSDYDIVKAFMVMKTPVVACEAWDILDA